MPRAVCLTNILDSLHPKICCFFCGEGGGGLGEGRVFGKDDPPLHPKRKKQLWEGGYNHTSK